MISINASESLYTITERYPETIPFFTAQGFPQVADSAKRETLGKSITLETAVRMKRMDVDAFIRQLTESIGHTTADQTLSPRISAGGDSRVTVKGLLPCPVRLPLLEGFSAFADAYHEKTGTRVEYELQAASSGLGAFEHELRSAQSEDDLPDIFISAGFDMFFDPARFGRFIETGVFADYSGFRAANAGLSSANFPDPRGYFSVISIVPAVFLVNTQELGPSPLPRTWEDILAPEFEQRVSLPVGDFDLFNAMLLSINKLYGMEGIRRLGKSLLQSMHPAEMVKSERKPQRPAVTIMPYFFTKTVREGGPMKAVWPEDGAITSPIFLLSKAGKREALKPLVEFLASRETGEILAHRGLFPSLHPDVDNGISSEKKFLWLGWDYIMKNDIGALITETLAVFNESAGEKR